MYWRARACQQRHRLVQHTHSHMCNILRFPLLSNEVRPPISDFAHHLYVTIYIRKETPDKCTHTTMRVWEQSETFVSGKRTFNCILGVNTICFPANRCAKACHIFPCLTHTHNWRETSEHVSTETLKYVLVLEFIYRGIAVAEKW